MNSIHTIFHRIYFFLSCITFTNVYLLLLFTSGFALTLGEEKNDLKQKKTK